MRKFFRKIALLFMVFGMASVVNAKCINADGKWEDGRPAKDMVWKTETEKTKKAVEEILQIIGLTREQATAKGYDYVKFLNGIEMLQKSDRCMFGYKNILEEYADKKNDEYYFYGAKTPRELKISGFMRLLGDDLSGESGELKKKKLQAEMSSHNNIW